MAQANSSMNVNLKQMQMEEVNSYQLRKHLVIWLLVIGASFGEKTLLFHMTRSQNQKFRMRSGLSFEEAVVTEWHCNPSGLICNVKNTYSQETKIFWNT